MNDCPQIAKHVRDVHFGGNWTGVNLTDALADVSCEEATKKIYSLNTIAALVFHMYYYVDAVLKVLHGEPLTASDKYSFDAPPIHSEHDWKKLTEKTWRQARELADLIDKLPDRQLNETFADEKYGTYYRNLHGIVEHIHYHLGQIVLIKKLLRHTLE